MNWEQQKAAMDEFERENTPTFVLLTPEQVTFEHKVFKPGMDAYEANEAANNATFSTWEDVFVAREQEIRNIAAFFEAVAMMAADNLLPSDVPGTNNKINYHKAYDALNRWTREHGNEWDSWVTLEERGKRS